MNQPNLNSIFKPCFFAEEAAASKRLRTKLSLLLVFFFGCLCPFLLTAQNLPFDLDCNNPPIQNQACGVLNAAIGLTGNEIFCEGDEIVCNNLTPQPVDSSIFCWGDGSAPVIVAGNLGASHKYDFSRDTCLLSGHELIRRTVTLIVFKRCAGGFSASVGQKFIYIRVRPRVSLSVPSVICENTPFTILNSSCGNDVADSVKCSYVFGDEQTENNCSKIVSHQYARAGSYQFVYTMSNSCGSRTPFAVTIHAAGLPQAKAELLSGAQSAAQPYAVCLTGGSAFAEVTGRNSVNSAAYAWAVSSATVNIIPRKDTVSPHVLFTKAGDYSLILKGSNECSKVSYDTLRFHVVEAEALVLGHQENDCDHFLYKPFPPVANARYERFFNGISQGFFDPVQGFDAVFGRHIIVATLSNDCNPNQISRDTFTVAPPQDARFLLPQADTTVCQGSDFVLLAVSPPGANIKGGGSLAMRHDSVFFNPDVPGVFNLSYTVGTGKCQRSASRTITVSAIQRLQLNAQADRCQPFYYKPSPVVPNAAYALNGTPFSDSVYVGIGDYTVQAALASFCGRDTARIRFKVTGAVPIQVFSRDTTVCVQGGSFALKGAGGVWQNRQGLTNGVFDPAAAGIGTSVVTFSGGVGECVNSQRIKITVQGVPNVSAGNDTAICKISGAPPVLLNRGRPTGGVYRLNNPFAGPVVTELDPAALAAGTYKIFYVLNDTAKPLSCPTYDSLSAVVNEIPTAAAQIPASACAGLETRLEALNTLPAQTYRWLVNDTARGSTAVFNFVFRYDGVARVALTVSNSSGCSATYKQDVIVRRAPQPFFSLSQDGVCSGRWLKITGDARLNDSATTYRWTFRGKNYDAAQLDSLFMSNIGCADSVYTLRLAAATGSCAEAFFEKAVTVYPKITAQIAGVQGQSDSVCSNKAVFFVNSSCGKISRFTWNLGGQKFIGRDPGAWYFNNNSDTVRQVTVSLTAEEAGECAASDTAYYRLWVFPSAVRARFSFNSRAGCPPFAVRFHHLTPFASGYLYDFGDGSTVGDPDPVKTYETPGVYHIRLRVFDPCGGFDDFTDSVVVRKTAKTAGLTFEKVEKCDEYKIRVKPNIQYGVLGRIWADSVSLTDATGNPVIIFPGPGAYWVKYSAVNDSTGCSVVDSGLAAVRPIFQLERVVFPDSCGNGNGAVALTAKGGSGAYLFSKSDTLHWQKDQTFRNILAGGIYTFFARDSAGCRLSANVKMAESARRSINVGRDTVVAVCDSFSRQISANFTIKTIQWKINSGEGAIKPPDGVKATVVAYKTSEIYVAAADSVGCSAEGVFRITVDQQVSVYVPNSFSPNGDGRNDCFFPNFSSNSIEIVEFDVFNRWGGLMHSAKNVPAGDPSAPWDGRYEDKLLEPGVFIWSLRYRLCNGETPSVLTGDVSLIR